MIIRPSPLPGGVRIGSAVPRPASSPLDGLLLERPEEGLRQSRFPASPAAGAVAAALPPPSRADLVPPTSPDPPAPLPRSLPEHAGHRAVVYGPAGDGHLRRTLRLPCDVRDGETLVTPGGLNEGYVAVHHGHTSAIDVIGPDGEVRASCRLPARSPVLFMSADDARRRLYVQTPDAVLAFDATTGGEVGQVRFDQRDFNHSSRMAPLPDGGILLARYHALQWLDPDLAPIRQVELRYLLSCVRPLADGSVLAWDGDFSSQVTHVAPDGSPWLEHEGSFETAPPSLAEDGSLWYVEKGRGGFRRQRDEVHRYDPATRRDETVGTGWNLAAAVPIPGGRCLAVVEAPEPSVELMDPSRPETLKRFSFGPGGRTTRARLGPLLVAEDGRQAWVTVERSDSVSSTDTLFRLSLDDEPGRGSGLRGRKDLAEPVLEGSPGSPMLPVVLADGRLLAFSEKKITLVESDGRSRIEFQDMAPLAASLGPDARVGARMVSAKSVRMQPTGTSLADWLAAGARHAGLPWHPPHPPSAAGAAWGPLVDLDGGYLEFSRAVTCEEARRDAGVDIGSAADESRQHPPDERLALRPSLELPFADGSRSRVVVEGSRASITRPASDAPANQVSLDGDPITAVLPLSSGDHRYVALGTAGGKVVWMNGEAGLDAEQVVLPFQGPVTAIGLSTDNRILVGGSGDEMLIFEPHLDRGEVLRAVTQAPGTGRSESHLSGSGIQVENDHVNIGGLRLPRRKDGRDA